MTSPRVLLLLAGLALSSLAEAAARPPNILFIYLDDFGMRSEINVYISQGKPVVSGKKPQFELMHF